MNGDAGKIFLTYVIIHQVCDHTILKFVYLLITDHLEFLTGLMFSMYIVWESRKYTLRFSNISILFDMFL